MYTTTITFKSSTGSINDAVAVMFIGDIIPRYYYV